jgi:hypothetical protein
MTMTDSAGVMIFDVLRVIGEEGALESADGAQYLEALVGRSASRIGVTARTTSCGT